MWLFPLSLLILFEIIADVFAKEWSLRDRPLFWIGAILSYLLANTFWLFALKYGSGLARGAVIFSVASAIFAIIIGAIFYRENVSGIQWIGMFIGIISLVFIFWADIQRTLFS